jgi:polar amino acid transport system ATP-binding protein
MNQVQNGHFVRIVNLSKSYGKLQVLNGIDLNIELGERLIIIGPSGGGKSTLLRCLMGLERIDARESSSRTSPIFRSFGGTKRHFKRST